MTSVVFISSSAYFIIFSQQKPFFLSVYIGKGIPKGSEAGRLTITAWCIVRAWENLFKKTSFCMRLEPFCITLPRYVCRLLNTYHKKVTHLLCKASVETVHGECKNVGFLVNYLTSATTENYSAKK